MRTAPSSESSANCPSSRGPRWGPAAAPDLPSRRGPVGKAACPSRVTCSAPLRPPRRPAPAPPPPGPCCSPPSPLGLDPTRASQWPLQDPVWGTRSGGAATQGWECTDRLPKTLGSPSAAFTPNVLARYPPGLSCFLFLLRHLPHSKRRQLPGLPGGSSLPDISHCPCSGLGPQAPRLIPAPGRPQDRSGWGGRAGSGAAHRAVCLCRSVRGSWSWGCGEGPARPSLPPGPLRGAVWGLRDRALPPRPLAGSPQDRAAPLGGRAGGEGLPLLRKRKRDC